MGHFPLPPVTCQCRTPVGFQNVLLRPKKNHYFDTMENYVRKLLGQPNTSLFAVQAERGCLPSQNLTKATTTFQPYSPVRRARSRLSKLLASPSSSFNDFQSLNPLMCSDASGRIVITDSEKASIFTTAFTSNFKNPSVAPNASDSSFSVILSASHIIDFHGSDLFAPWVIENSLRKLPPRCGFSPHLANEGVNRAPENISDTYFNTNFRNPIIQQLFDNTHNINNYSNQQSQNSPRYPTNTEYSKQPEHSTYRGNSQDARNAQNPETNLERSRSHSNESVSNQQRFLQNYPRFTSESNHQFDWNVNSNIEKAIRQQRPTTRQTSSLRLHSE
ncbi:hypothetical protein CRE_31273 [Caenorhabditis remanei]|uniref:Uncharacterized protein n=1 Tax=Caenorhabditis remanei TaxID=31234 RepID=E3MLK4_CAERE|nr:hypothetical protein CRE_31273 [Caenorhabditis remanei]